jgi:hypothetical protein
MPRSREAGCQVIRAEKASGARRNGRSELQILLDFNIHPPIASRSWLAVSFIAIRMSACDSTSLND